MKKIFTALFVLLFTANLFCQTNMTIDITDDVYALLRNCETRNLCEPLHNVKPYTEKYIVTKLNEILKNLEQIPSSSINMTEKQIIISYLKKYEHKEGFDLKNRSIRFEDKNEKFPISFEFNNNLDGLFSAGIYGNSDFNSKGYEFYDTLDFFGDFGKDFSYRAAGFIGITQMPLQYMGDYNIGKWLYHDYETQDSRFIHKYVNNSVLPFSYKKFWDGSCYFLTDVSSSGLEGWAVEPAMAFGMYGELHGSFFDNRVELAFSRINREWGAMDNDSSLVLNSHARPFLGIESSFNLFKWLSFSSITGIMEFPNQDFINDDAFYLIDDQGRKIDDVEDYYFFQNAFSMAMLDLNFKYFHFDFGSSCIWPKRFELGYMFPLIDNVIYQNDVGDYDNLSLFTDMKFIYPGIGSIWFSAYLDEVSAIKTKFWEKTRAMFATQVGTKAAIPFLPFTTVSFRYTKVEPFCYTHHGINYTSWYDHYLSESYTNNGECLGYYLPPNSDEFNLRIETRPMSEMKLGLQFQLIRHGVDWGSGSIAGNNLYSELRNYDRDDLYKYFLKDGVYEWSNIISLSASYDLRTMRIPFAVYCNIGYIYDWFTGIDGEPGKDASYSYINTNEYSDKHGVVCTIGFSLY